MVSKRIHLLSIKGLSWLKADGDLVLIESLNTLEELSFLQEASCEYQENSLRRLRIGGQKVYAVRAAEEG